MSTPPEKRTTRSRTLDVGDRVQLTDTKGRVHTVVLEVGKKFFTHHGAIAHDDLIGAPEGNVVTSDRGMAYLAFRPLYADFVLSMPRGATVVYPKDAAQILVAADVFPGSRVLEAGAGSGALTCALLRAVGDNGSVASFERREEFAEVARKNVTTFFGSMPSNWSLTVGDLAPDLAASEVDEVDRVVLDMLAPWECVDAVAQVLIPGGVLCCYVATTTQLSRLVEDVRSDGRFTGPCPTRRWCAGGMSKGSPCVPTTAWWGIPDSS